MGDEQKIFNCIAIIGVGLIGGSIGMAAKKNSLVSKVIGIGRNERRLMKAKILGAIDDYSTSLHDSLSEADAVFICTPVRMVIPTLRNIIPHLKEDAIVTDVGSTKREICMQAADLMPSRRVFLGGHPMAGSEQTGVEYAIPDLFLGATYVLTPDENCDFETLGKMTQFVERIGAKAEIMSPEEHDAATAIISHLPHVMAASLLHLAEKNQRETGKIFQLAAGSFRDLTRIADSSSELWKDICLTNADSICESIDSYIGYLDKFRNALMECDEAAIEKLFESAKEFRETYVRIKR